METAGDVLQIVLPAAAYGMTFLMDDKDGRWPFYLSFATTMGVTYALKYTVERERPGGGDTRSFPSGHTSAAFSGASFIQRRYGWLYGTFAYGAAAVVGWSRIEADHHHPEDALVGAAIGIVSTYIFTRPFKKDLQITPIAEPGMLGVALTAGW